jgi:predicted phage tail protein
VITSKLGTNTLRWANPDDATLARVEIWRSETNNKGDATLIAAELGSVFVDTGVAIGTTYYYWLRTVDFAGNEGPFEPATDTTTYSVVTGGIQNDDLDPNIQFVVEIQEGEVESAHLAAGAVTAEKTKIKRHMIY